MVHDPSKLRGFLRNDAGCWSFNKTKCIYIYIYTVYIYMSILMFCCSNWIEFWTKRLPLGKNLPFQCTTRLLKRNPTTTTKGPEHKQPNLNWEKISDWRGRDQDFRIFSFFSGANRIHGFATMRWLQMARVKMLERFSLGVFFSKKNFQVLSYQSGSHPSFSTKQPSG